MDASEIETPLPVEAGETTEPVGEPEDAAPEQADPGPEQPEALDEDETAEPVEAGATEEPEELPTPPEAIPETTLDEPVEGEPEGAETQTVVAAIPRTKPPVPAGVTSSAPRGEALRPARRLLSGDLLADGRVRTAMRGMSDSERLNLLCATELRAQLQAQNPPILPDLLPTFQTPPGLTVLRPSGAAFRTFGTWHNVDFRCQVDRAITRVESFSLRVGQPVPRSQWRSRGFPIF
ncbi:hypothetical protein LAX5112_04983 [Roseibium alexandrii]|uniref:DUF930 domain-containing protein n=1 Tax=Roseibium alexandrii TaxID=388408 RepID=A0A0M7ASY6_9HYPH|nr:hypothetical protein LAX5112_04983 [Roseibium alexandrii]